MPKSLPAILNNLSLVPLQVQARFGDDALPVGKATGFLYRSGDQKYFVTNWHVVTGRHADTGKPLDEKTCAVPDSLSFMVPFQRPEDDKPVVTIWWEEAKVPLYKDQERRFPLWLEHPTHGGRADVAVIPFDVDKEYMAAIPANDSKALGLNTPVVYPTLTVFVLGYPLGLVGGLNLPIYKRATIANEAEFPLGDMPKIYIDTATRKGMSGAPVFVDQMGSWLQQMPDGKRVLQVGGRGRLFLGIYAARDGLSTEFEAQLGIVWKAEVIDEVIAGGKAGTSSFWLENSDPH